MADKVAQQKEVDSKTSEEVTKSKPTEEVDGVDDESKSENGESTENGDKEDKEEEVVEDEKNGDAETDKVCSVKRKSVGGGGDSTDAATPAEGATPEKKAKLDETAEAESNGEAEVAA